MNNCSYHEPLCMLIVVGVGEQVEGGLMSGRLVVVACPNDVVGSLDVLSRGQL